MGLRACLEDQDQLVVVGESSNGRNLLEVVERAAPDVVLLSEGIEADGFDNVCIGLRELMTDCGALLLTLELRRDLVLAAARLGVRGICMLQSKPSELVLAIYKIKLGGFSLPDQALEWIMEDYSNLQPRGRGEAAVELAPKPAASTGIHDSLHELSDREKQVLRFVAGGMTSRGIAEKLGISARTVEAHRARIGDKLGIRTVAGLTRFALKAGMQVELDT
jgi:DNA-binding NarL/FixJ family response regulator